MLRSPLPHSRDHRDYLYRIFNATRHFSGYRIWTLERLHMAREVYRASPTFLLRQSVKTVQEAAVFTPQSDAQEGERAGGVCQLNRATMQARERVHCSGSLVSFLTSRARL